MEKKVLFVNLPIDLSDYLETVAENLGMTKTDLVISIFDLAKSTVDPRKFGEHYEEMIFRDESGTG